MNLLSIVIPCYNEEKTIPIFYPAVEKEVKKINNLNVEYWFVDDGSNDSTYHVIKKLHDQHENVHYIMFSRNFGKEAALYAGLKAANGNFITVMDADLQDPPHLLPIMYKYLKSGKYDCIGTRRVDRQGEGRIKSFFSNMFYKLINHISNTKIVPGMRDYRMMTRQMTDAVLSMTEYNRFSKGIFSWVGFRTKYLEYHNIERVAGETDWSIWSLFKYAVNGITDFSEVPLSIAVWLGLISSFLAILGIIFIIIRHVIYPNSSVFGWASLVSIILFLGGLQLLCLGIIGKYIGKIYLQTKHRPIYIIKEKK